MLLFLAEKEDRNLVSRVSGTSIWYIAKAQSLVRLSMDVVLRARGPPVPLRAVLARKVEGSGYYIVWLLRYGRRLWPLLPQWLMCSYAAKTAKGLVPRRSPPS